MRLAGGLRDASAVHSRHCRQSLRARRPPGRSGAIGSDPVRWLDASAQGCSPAVAGEGLALLRGHHCANPCGLRREIRTPGAPQPGKDGDAAALQAARYETAAALPADLHGRGNGAVPAGSGHRPAVRGATHPVLDESLRRLGRQDRRTRSGGSLRTGSHPPARVGQLHATCCWRSSSIRRCSSISTITFPSARTRWRRRLSPAQREAQLGINENLAREIIELHTLGVGGGYTQADVTTLLKSSPDGRSVASAAAVRQRRAGTVRVSPRDARAGRESRARQTLSRQRHRAGCRRSSRSRDPAVDRALHRHQAWRGTSSRMIRRARPSSGWRKALSFERRRSADGISGAAHLPEAWAQPLSKYKTPSDYIVSTFRGLDLPVGDGRGALGAVRGSGSAHLQSRVRPPGGRTEARTGRGARR